MSLTSAAPLKTTLAFRRRARYVVALITAVVVGLLVLWATRQAVLLVFTGVSLGALFYYASEWLAERVGGARGLWLGVLVTLMLGAFGLAVILGAPNLLTQARGLLDAAPDVLSATERRLGLPDSALSIPKAFEGLTGRALGIFSSLAGIVTGVIVILVVAVYTAASPSTYTEGFVRLVDREHQAFVRRILHRMGRTLLGWTRGVGIAVTLLTIIGAIGLSVIGVPGALALAVFAGAMTAIPTFGPLVGWAPAVAVGFASGTTTGLWTLGLAVVAQQVEGSFITPKVQGRMVSVPPAAIIAAQIVLGSLAGFLGILLAVPVAGVALVLMQELYIGPFVEGEGADPETHEAPPEADAYGEASGDD
ncbi:AI-2E family transporter [Rubricoccus marinus]|uniref:AI-2E family transporter n=1 Tax=Rubricoccus marinus TaxID=716817 RepID=A0A259U1B8_9BACT|nr:AI-2E family transporter [Rubricoccus marinus]OZC03614.1 hypothetical protein BSZ36_11840 [Rubricoccus marinus]